MMIMMKFMMKFMMFNKEIKKDVNVIHQVIEKEEVVEYNVNYCEVNYEYEHVEEVDYVQNKPYLVDDEH